MIKKECRSASGPHTNKIEIPPGFDFNFRFVLIFSDEVLAGPDIDLLLYIYADILLKVLFVKSGGSRGETRRSKVPDGDLTEPGSPGRAALRWVSCPLTGVAAL